MSRRGFTAVAEQQDGTGEFSASVRTEVDALNWLAETTGGIPLETAAHLLETLAAGTPAGAEIQVKGKRWVVRVTASGAQTATERKAAERARRQALGLQRAESWVHPDDLPRLRAYVGRLNRARSRAKAGPQ